MNLGILSKQFLVDDDASPEEWGRLIEKLLPHCVVRKNGTVEIKNGRLSARLLAKLVLSARLVASKVNGSSVKSDVTVGEIADFTGIPKNQSKARAKELVDEHFAERTARGSYRARRNKIDVFLDGLSGASDAKKGGRR
jgi:sulfur carrier protein ThiS